MKLSKEFIEIFRLEAKKAQWEINSWNGKGIDDLVVDYLERKELKPEDFTGVVVLTIEEAKEIIGTYIGTNCEIVKQHGIPELKIKNPDWLIHLLERIEHAEATKICDDYNKSLNRVAEEFQRRAEKCDA